MNHKVESNAEIPRKYRVGHISSKRRYRVGHIVQRRIIEKTK